MSVLSIIKETCRRIGLTVPNAATGSADPQIIQLVAILNEEGQELAQRHEWQRLITEATFETVADTVQTTIPNGLKYIINDTIWNRDLRRPVFGPLTGQRWQQLKAMSMQGPWHQFRVVGNEIRFIPSPSAGQHCYYEYVSKNWAYDIDGTGKDNFTSDDDETYLDEQLLALGLKWRWKSAKGMEYAEDFNTYERRVLDAIGRDGSRDTLNMTDNRWDIYPGIVVPSGSWNV